MARELLNEADALFQQSKYEEAATTFKYLVRADPTQLGKIPLVRFNLAYCLFELKRYAEAEEHFEYAGASLMAKGMQTDLAQRTFFFLAKSQLEQNKPSFAKQNLERAQMMGEPRAEITQMINEINTLVLDAQPQETKDKTQEEDAGTTSMADDVECDTTATSTMSRYEQVLEQFSDVVESPERLQQGIEVQEMIKAMPTRIEEDSEWFFLPKKWLTSWELYCYVDIINYGPQDGPESKLRNVGRKKPEPIEFSDLFEPHGKNQFIEQVVKKKWQNNQIKKGMREGVDFILVTKDVLTYFVKKYSSVEKDPEKNFMRIGVE